MRRISASPPRTPTQPLTAAAKMLRDEAQAPRRQEDPATRGRSAGKMTIVPAPSVPPEASQAPALARRHRFLLPNAHSSPVETATRKLVELGDREVFQPRPRAFPAETRIAVIGGGPGGLSAAEFLERCGYENVTVLEKEGDVGGRVQSFQVLDEQGEPLKGKDGHPLVYEYGACVAASGYRDLELLLPCSDVQLGTPVHALHMSTEKGGKFELLSPMEKLRLPFEALWLMGKRATSWRAVNEPGFADIPPELSRPAAAVLGAHAPTVLKIAAGPTIGFGYGYWGTQAAATMLKYLRPGQTIANQYCMFPQGFQKLFRDVAAGLDVRTGCRVDSVAARADGKLEVATSAGPMTFDKVIWTGPLQHATGVLKDIPPALRTKMDQSIRGLDYRTYVCRIDGLPRNTGAFYIDDNLTEKGENRPIFMYNAHPEAADICNVYVIADGKAGDAEVQKNIVEDLGKMKVSVKDFIESRRWDYFPHALPGHLDVFKEIDAFQGQHGIYLAGAGMEFDTTNDAVRASGAIVNEHFLVPPLKSARGPLARALAGQGRGPVVHEGRHQAGEI